MAPPAVHRIIADRYAIKASLGWGGMGVVWRAQDLVLDREVAVKEVVFPATMPEEERRPAQARVMREARAAARLNHPAAVVLYDVVQDRGNMFIVMELVNAPTLADLVAEQGPLPPVRVAEIGAQVAARWMPPTTPGSCIAMSSRATSWCLSGARPSWPTLGSPRSRATPS